MKNKSPMTPELNFLTMTSGSKHKRLLPRFITALFCLAFTIASPTAAQNKKVVTPTAKPVTIAANSKSSSPLLTKQEQEILAEINLARSDPAQYARYVIEFRKLYKDRDIYFADGTSIITNEGTAAVDEAIEFLRMAKPAAPLVARNGLVLAAKIHLQDLLKSGKSGHRGSDGSVPEQRFNRFGSWKDSVGENIVYRSRSARENVVSLIIDDGTANRGHRKNIFKTTFQVIGIAMDGPPKANTMCVITFAGDFIDKATPPAKGSTPTATKL